MPEDVASQIAKQVVSGVVTIIGVAIVSRFLTRYAEMKLAEIEAKESAVEVEEPK